MDENTYNPKARLSAFIFVDNKLYLSKTHTECLIQFLIDKKLIKNEKQFFKKLNNPKYEQQVQQWSDEVEKCSIFGELSFYQHGLAMFVFDNISEFGLKCLSPVMLKQFGRIPLYYAEYNCLSENKFILHKLL